MGSEVQLVHFAQHFANSSVECVEIFPAALMNESAFSSVAPFRKAEVV